MKLNRPWNRDVWDIHDFITRQERQENADPKMFKLLLEMKLSILFNLILKEFLIEKSIEGNKKKQN